ncbi:hypothetical protein IWX90DRAFT_140098 [Phyllosticta citrichinensis]|uniref:Uncharacterized protein n=1 Tax=Phyllosticta citrichinensis TaxID=1130410 RepID=A0ABR1XYZ5_9PEZI
MLKSKLSPLRNLRPIRDSLRQRCAHSTKPSESPPAAARKQSRLDRIISRLPRGLQAYLLPLRSAPLTHVTAFLILHEITAIVPLVGLAATFHYGNWLPSSLAEGVWVQQGVERFGRYFRKKGWIEEEAEAEAEQEIKHEGGERDLVLQGGTMKLLVEIGTAWAITKALLPARLLLSTWATPWFARVFLAPFANVFKRTLTKTSGPPPPPPPAKN